MAVIIKKSSEEAGTKRLKAYLYGPTGVGKTIFGCYMPGVLFIDTDGGLEWYKEKFQFDYVHVTNIEDIYELVEQLRKDSKPYKTLVIDTITTYYDLLQEKYLKRFRLKKGNPQYELQGQDWRPIKNELKSFVNKLRALDMNIVALAQDKVQYSAAPGEFMKPIGMTADGPKDLPFLFDTYLELSRGPNGERFAVARKDRTNKLPMEPQQFLFSYQEIIKYLDVKDLEREPVQLRTDTAMAKLAGGRKFKTTFHEKDIFTAGITGATLEQIEIAAANVSPADLAAKLQDDYSVESLLDLREDEAQLLAKDLNPTPPTPRELS